MYMMNAGNVLEILNVPMIQQPTKRQRQRLKRRRLHWSLTSINYICIFIVLGCCYYLLFIVRVVVAHRYRFGFDSVNEKHFRMSYFLLEWGGEGPNSR